MAHLAFAPNLDCYSERVSKIQDCGVTVQNINMRQAEHLSTTVASRTKHIYLHASRVAHMFLSLCLVRREIQSPKICVPARFVSDAHSHPSKLHKMSESAASTIRTHVSGLTKSSLLFYNLFRSCLSVVLATAFQNMAATSLL